MSDSTTVPVVAGLAVGVVFIVLISLAVTAASIPKGTLILTTADGKSYTASMNNYCEDQICDFLAHSRIIPSGDTIHISKESDFAFSIANAAMQPREIEFHLSNHDFSVNYSFDPQKRENGKYFIPAYFDSGEYIMDVLAYWDEGEGTEDTSFHRFKVLIE